VERNLEHLLCRITFASAAWPLSSVLGRLADDSGAGSTESPALDGPVPQLGRPGLARRICPRTFCFCRPVPGRRSGPEAVGRARRDSPLPALETLSQGPVGHAAKIGWTCSLPAVAAWMSTSAAATACSAAITSTGCIRCRLVNCWIQEPFAGLRLDDTLERLAGVAGRPERVGREAFESLPPLRRVS